MIFSKIEYVNLLPFHIYLKNSSLSSQFKQSINYKKSYPSNINYKFKKRVTNAAFISSIEAKKSSCTDIGIVAKKEVLSVLVLKNSISKIDLESSTSNVLAKILDIDGEVIIGDKALKLYYSNKNIDFIDLALYWHNKYRLPFVFATFCFNSNSKFFKKLSNNFAQKSKRIRIPNYILSRYSKKLELSNSQILNYLDRIDYQIGYKERRALKLFWKLSKKIK